MDKSKHIVIVGASSGIGNLVARIYAERGCRVIVCARRIEKLNELKQLYPDFITPIEFDVNAENASGDFMTILKSCGDVDIVLNCAGIGYYNPGLDTDQDLQTVRTDCVGFTAIADAAFNYFAGQKREGQFAAISSIAGVRSLGMSLSYSASKRFQNMYLTGLDQLRRIRKLPIIITDIRPGFVDTDLLDKSRRYPMKMKADHVAQLVVKAIDKKKRVAVLDWRYKILVFFWQMIPNRLWVRLPIKLSL